MVKFNNLCLHVSTAIAALCAFTVISACRADSPVTANLLENAGFENWSTATNLGTPPVLTNGGSVPVSWDASPETQAPKDNPGTYTGAIYEDTTVKHSGNASLRLESARNVDIVAVTQQVSVDPNSKYLVTFWYKGDNIQQDGGQGGVFVWGVYGPTQDYWNHMTFTTSIPTVHDGTFDWTQGNYTIDTNSTAGLMRFTLQLRRATGKLWFDDVQIVKLGAVTAVKSF